MAQRNNPYIAGAPLRGERGFYGRQDTLDWVVRELRNPATNALVLFGQRRIGKTTLLLQLQRTLPATDFLPVYFDLQDQAPRPLGKVLADLADTLAERAMMDAPAIEAFDDRGRFFRREFLPKLYAALGEQRRPVFLLDEFDVLDQAAEAELPETAAAKSLFPFLRTVITEDVRPAFVFVVGRRAEDLSVNFTATFKASLVHEVWVLDQESAMSLVRQAEVNGSLRYTNAAVERILNLTDRHPYLIQLVCQRIWELAYAVQPTTPPKIDVIEVEAAIADALETGAQALIWLWNGLGPAERIYAAALAEIANEGETIPEDRVISVLASSAARLRTREIELAPRDLVKRRVLDAAGDRQYRFAVEVFRRWVRKNKPLIDVKDEIDRVEPEANQMFSIGVALAKRRQWESAKRYFEDALAANPRHFQAHVHLGEMLLELDKVDDAVNELDKAYQLDRDEARLPLARALTEQARARSGAGDEDGALAVADRALEISPNEQLAREIRSSIWQRRGDAALQRDDLAEAQTAYENSDAVEQLAKIRTLRRTRELAWWEQEAQTSESAGNWSDAASLYERLIKQYPEEGHKSDWEAALARSREEDDLARLFADGVVALQRGDSDMAQRAFANVIYRRPNYAKEKTAAEMLMNALTIQKAVVPKVYQTAEPTEVLGEKSLPPVSTKSQLLSSDESFMTLTIPPSPRSTFGLLWIIVLAGLALAALGSSPSSALIILVLDVVIIGWWLSPKRPDVRSIAFSPDSATLVSGGANKVSLWKVSDGTLFQTLNHGAFSNVYSVTFSPDGKMLASGGVGSVRLWHIDGTDLGSLGSGLYNSATFSPDGTIIACGGANNDVEIWQVSDKKLLQKFSGHTGSVESVAFSPDGTIIASGSRDKTVRLWQVFDGALLQTLSGHTGSVKNVAFSPDGALLATIGEYDTVRLWRVSDGELVCTFKTTQSVYDIAFASDGATLAVGSYGETQIWRVSDQTLARVFKRYIAERVSSVNFSPDGSLLASGCNGGTIHLWNLL